MTLQSPTKSRGILALALSLLMGRVDAQNATASKNPECVPIPEGIVGWWPGDIGAKDRLGKIDGEAGEGTDYVAGKVGKAFSFDITDATVKIPRLLDLETGTGLSITFWLRPSKTGLYPIAEWNDGKGHPATHLYVWGGEGRLWFNLLGPRGEGHLIASGAGIIKPDVYQHVAATYDMEIGMARLYRNSVLMAEEYLGKFRPLTDRDLYLAFRTPDNHHFKGDMDEVCIFNRSLKSSEILTIYAAGSAGMCFPETDK